MVIETMSSIYGNILCPNNFSELLSLLINNEEYYSSEGVCYWRGQADINWRLDSGAVRRLKNNTLSGNFTDYDIELYEKDLIFKAKKKLFHY